MTDAHGPTSANAGPCVSNQASTNGRCGRGSSNLGRWEGSPVVSDHLVGSPPGNSPNGARHMTESLKLSHSLSLLVLPHNPITQSSSPFSTLLTMSGKFEPKVPVNLDPPKDDPISQEELAAADGTAMFPPRHDEESLNFD